MLIAPIGLGVLWALVQVLGQPATAAAMVTSASAASDVAVTLLGAFAAIAKAVGEYALITPVVWACAFAALLSVAAWLYRIRRLALQGLML